MSSACTVYLLPLYIDVCSMSIYAYPICSCNLIISLRRQATIVSSLSEDVRPICRLSNAFVIIDICGSRLTIKIIL